LRACAATGAAAVLARPAIAQTAWPAKPIRVVVPFPAGTSPDTVGRLIGEKLTAMWGQPVLIDNRAGAAGGIGAELVAAAPPDGYTALLTVSSVITINPHVYASLRYQPLEFVPVTQVLTVPYVMIAPPSAPYSTMAELVEAARRKPGSIDYASYGVGSQTQVAVEIWAQQAGIRLNHVPYATNPTADLMGGVTGLLMEPSTTAIPLVKGGRVKALAVTSDTRLPALPQVPAAGEFRPGLASVAWHGIFVPKNTPPAVAQKFNADTVRVLALPEVRARLSELGLLVAGSTPDELAQRMQSEHAAWGRAVRELGIKLQ
jgi:tripartite-type tricarboxylate transporter receptor subunit TctC